MNSVNKTLRSTGLISGMCWLMCTVRFKRGKLFNVSADERKLFADLNELKYALALKQELLFSHASVRLQLFKVKRSLSRFCSPIGSVTIHVANREFTFSTNH